MWKINEKHEAYKSHLDKCIGIAPIEDARIFITTIGIFITLDGGNQGRIQDMYTRQAEVVRLCLDVLKRFNKDRNCSIIKEIEAILNDGLKKYSGVISLAS